MRRLSFLSAVFLALVSGPALAGEVVIGYISEKDQPVKKMPKDGEKRLIETYGEKQGREMWAATMAQADAQHYSVTLINEDKLRRAVKVSLLVEFYDKSGRKLGQTHPSYDVTIDPDESENVTVECGSPDPMCRGSHSISPTVMKTEWKELKYGTADEIAFEWKQTRWFLENRWDQDKKAILRTFSGAAYTDEGFDGKVFLPPNFNLEKRYYRVAKEPIPGGFPKDPTSSEVDVYFHELLPGIKVEKGQKKKPGLLDTDVVNLEIKGTIEVGEPVQPKEIRVGKKDVVIVLAPICATVKDHRWLRAVAKFVFEKDQLKNKDFDFLDRSVREWLEPISIRQVAEICGPNSGTPVKRWDPNTTTEDVEADLGPADARSDTAKGEVLAYGPVKLTFLDGRLAGVEKRQPKARK